MLVWFSAALKVADEVKTGELSFKSDIFIVMLWLIELTPSDAVAVNE